MSTMKVYHVTIDAVFTMALNWTMLDESKQPVPLGDEHTVMTIDKGVEVTLNIPEPGKNSKKLKESGRVWLTEQRLIFVNSSTSGDPGFESLSIPMPSLLSTSFMQPTFSANYLSIDIKPSPGGGLSEGTKAEIRFKDQAMFGFVSTLEKLRERALFMKRESAMGDELPRYTSPSTFSSSSSCTPLPVAFTSTNPPLEAPPGYDAA